MQVYGHRRSCLSGRHRRSMNYPHSADARKRAPRRCRRRPREWEDAHPARARRARPRPRDVARRVRRRADGPGAERSEIVGMAALARARPTRGAGRRSSALGLGRHPRLVPGAAGRGRPRRALRRPAAVPRHPAQLHADRGVGARARRARAVGCVGRPVDETPAVHTALFDLDEPAPTPARPTLGPQPSSPRSRRPWQAAPTRAGSRLLLAAESAGALIGVETAARRPPVQRRAARRAADGVARPAPALRPAGDPRGARARRSARTSTRRTSTRTARPTSSRRCSARA